MTIEQAKKAFKIAKWYELKESTGIIEDFENDPKGIEKSRDKKLVSLLLNGKIKEVKKEYEEDGK